MFFSVLIPVYNVEKYLTECIESVLNQSFSDYEIILIDDGSTDQSGYICDEYAERFPQIINVKHTRNQGLFATRRSAFSMASGEYFLCVDADDRIEPGMLLELFNTITKDYPDMVLYDLYEWNDEKIRNVNEKNSILKPYILYSNLDILKRSLLDMSYVCWSMCSKCVKASVIDLDRDYSKLYNISYGEDTIQSLEVFNNVKTYEYSPKVMYYYRVGSGMTRSLPIKYLEDFYVVSQEIKKTCRDWCGDVNRCADVRFLKSLLRYLKFIELTELDFRKIKSSCKEISYVKKEMIEHMNLKKMYKDFSVIQVFELILVWKNKYDVLALIIMLKRILRQRSKS